MGVGWAFEKSTLKSRKIKAHMKLPDSYRKKCVWEALLQNKGKSSKLKLGAYDQETA